MKETEGGQSSQRSGSSKTPTLFSCSKKSLKSLLYTIIPRAIEIRAKGFQFSKNIRVLFPVSLYLGWLDFQGCLEEV